MAVMVRILLVVVLFMLSLTFPIVQSFFSGFVVVALAYMLPYIMGIE